MNAKNSTFGSRLVARLVCGGALCCALAANAVAQSGAQGGAKSGEGDQVKVSDYGTVTLAVQDTDLAQVLEMLSIQSQKNIITSKNVSATISANLYDVTFYEALDSILKVNGYDYVEEGNFIYIYTQAELEEMEAARRKTESRIFDLEYLSASDANDMITPLLSDAGQSSFRGDVEPGIEPDTSNAGRDDYAFTAKLVVSDYPENLGAIAGLLKELDHSPQQILLETTILQAAVDEANAFGIDFSVIGSMDFLDIANPLSPVNELLNGDDPENGFQPSDSEAQGLQSTVGNTPGAAGFKIGFVQDDVSVFMKLLDEVTNVTLLARPKVMCLNRQRAEILIGLKVGYLSTTATETSTTEAVEFLDTGLRVNFRPFISNNGMIRLELAPSASEAQFRTITDRLGNQRTIPDQFTNEITTNVRVRDGETLVLGGLFRENTKSNRRQVPLLGDMPILGAAFRGHDDTVERDEIIFLITPSIVHDETLWAMGDDVLGRVDAVRVGAREGLLPFSQERQSSHLNNRAVQAYNEGDLGAALHYANHSLQINPQQGGMIKFREMVTGAKLDYYDRGLLQRVLDRELGRVPALEGERKPAETSGAWTPESPLGSAMGTGAQTGSFLDEYFSTLGVVAAPSWSGDRALTGVEVETETIGRE